MMSKRNFKKPKKKYKNRKIFKKKNIKIGKYSKKKYKNRKIFKKNEMSPMLIFFNLKNCYLFLTLVDVLSIRGDEVTYSIV
jgi:hypothetical protein